MNRFRIPCFLALATFSLCIALGATADAWKPSLMPAAEETSEALAAGPLSIRAGAGVYLLGAEGFVLARPSQNGFHCLVERSQEGAFEPQCFDAEGSETLLPAVLLAAELVQTGHSREEVERRVAAAWAEGRLRAPSRPGINYMLSEKNRVPVGPERVTPFGPHLMFYAPYLTDADLGGDGNGETSPIFMINEGKPGGYVIVSVDGTDGHRGAGASDP